MEHPRPPAVPRVFACQRSVAHSLAPLSRRGGFTTADIQVTYAMVGAGLGYTVTNAINSSPQDTAGRHLPIEPPEIIEIGLAHCRDAAPAVKSFLKFIRPQLPAAPQTAL